MRWQNFDYRIRHTNGYIEKKLVNIKYDMFICYLQIYIKFRYIYKNFWKLIKTRKNLL